MELGDETTKIFLNAKGTVGEVDKDIANILSYVDGKAAEGKFTKDVALEVEKVKQHKETRVEYMTLMMELQQQRREGRKEGKDLALVSTIRNLMETAGWTAKQAMDALKIPAAEQEKYLAQV